MKDYSGYVDAVTRCMISFQYIEEALKMVLVRLEGLLYFRIKEFTPYHLKPKFDSIENAAMGRLIDMFNIYCDDADLIAELREIKKQRDIIAHKSFLKTFIKLQDKESIDLKTTDFETIDKDAGILLEKLVGKAVDLDTILNKIKVEVDPEQKS